MHSDIVYKHADYLTFIYTAIMEWFTSLGRIDFDYFILMALQKGSRRWVHRYQ